MFFEENNSNPQTDSNNTVERVQNISVIEPTSAPKWLIILFKVVGILNYLVATTVFLISILVVFFLYTQPWHIWLIPSGIIIQYIFLGYGFYKLAKWVAPFLVVAAISGVASSLYFIAENLSSFVKNWGMSSLFFTTLLGMIIPLTLVYIFIWKKQYFRGKYLHPVFSSLVLVSIVITIMAMWSSSAIFSEIVNNPRSILQNQKDPDRPLSQAEVDAIDKIIKSFSYPLSVGNEFTIRFPGKAQHATTKATYLPGISSNLNADRYIFRDPAGNKEYRLTSIKFESQTELNQTLLEKLAKLNIAKLPSTYEGDINSLLIPAMIRGNQALDFYVHSNASKIWILGRYIISNQTLYEIMAIYIDETYYPNDFDTFINSFELGNDASYRPIKYPSSTDGSPVIGRIDVDIGPGGKFVVIWGSGFTHGIKVLITGKNYMSTIPVDFIQEDGSKLSFLLPTDIESSTESFSIQLINGALKSNAENIILNST